MPAGSFTITPRGPFSLAESAGFGFGQRAAQPFDGVMRLALCADGYQQHVGVEVRQDPAETVHGIVHGPEGAPPGGQRWLARSSLSWYRRAFVSSSAGV
jgi:DNA-3-methyladenine glycosylase II